MKKPPTFALVLMGALVVSAICYLYASARANFFSAPKYVDWPFLYYVEFYVKSFLMIATPFILVSASLVIASRSVFVNVFTGVMIVFTRYFTYLATFEAKGADVVGVLLFMNLVIYWISGVVLILTAAIMATQTVARRPEAKSDQNATVPGQANSTVDPDAHKRGARGSP